MTVYLNKKLKELMATYGTETMMVYDNYYIQVTSYALKGLFSIFHYQLNELLMTLNNRINLRHYLAKDSRELINMIKGIKLIQTNLKDTDYRFEIDEYYEQVLATCKSFLSETRGSTIPDDFTEINIIENKPIFSLADSVSVRKSQATTSFTTKLIGEGSYAKVLKYKDTHYNRLFAIKRAKKELTKDELSRFKTEYLELAKLKSPYIIEVYNYNEEKNEYTMEYADTTLEKYINENNTKLTPFQRISLISQILKAFSYIHNKSLLHRDISYQNILIKMYEDSTIIKVSDFGLIKLIDSNLTRRGTDIKGVLNDPNLIEVGFENYEIRHETYALTRVLNFVLTGKTSGISYTNEKVKNFILKGINPNISERFSNVEEMIREFNKIKKELIAEKSLLKQPNRQLTIN